jgi:uncharacterized protein (TIGR00299 family) protein
MMKIAYLDCFSGVSGDMFLGALLDAGLPFEELKKGLESLPLDGYSLEMKREMKGALSATRFVVNVKKEEHVHRHLADIRKIIRAGRLSQDVQEKSLRVFESIAREEGRIHDRSPEKVFFHEVGAVDSIVDILGVVSGVELMRIDSLCVSSLPVGSGFVETEHGRIPIPAPATMALLEGIPVYGTGLKQELVTPTGAALVKELASSFGPLPSMTVEKVGYGAGSRDLPDRPNLLRIIVGHDQSGQQVDTVVILEANLDDTHPEWLGFLMDRLFEAGALDVVFCPVQMKKNRPGVLIQVMGRPEQKDELMDILFAESTTLGVRFQLSQRKTLERSTVVIDSPWGKMLVKKVVGPDGTSFSLPEYEACRKIAEEEKIPIKEVYYWVISSNRA